MVWIKQWVLNICCTILFLSAIDLILPKSNIKKYVKYVLGLVLISVVMSPIITIVRNKELIVNNININQQFNNSNSNSTKFKNDNYTTQALKNNLEIACEKVLKESLGGGNYKAEIQVYYDSIKDNYIIQGVRVGANSKETESSDGIKKQEARIKEVLCKELQIEQTYITVYKY